MTINITNDEELKEAIAACDEYLNSLSVPHPNPLVLVGDSRMNGDWNTLLGRTDIVNMSVAGSKASDWLANWPANCATITASGAKKVLVQYGKNEIDAERAVNLIAHDLQDVASIIQNHCPDVKVCVLATLPVLATSQNATYTNGQVALLLPQIISQMASASPVTAYLQGYQTLVDNGALMAIYTDDGTHLNASGKDIYKNTITQAEALLNNP